MTRRRPCWYLRSLDNLRRQMEKSYEQYIVRQDPEIVDKFGMLTGAGSDFAYVLRSVAESVDILKNQFGGE